MDDERILQRLDRVNDLGEPDPAFLAQLYDAVAEEVGFGEPRDVKTARVRGTTVVPRRRGGGTRRWPLVMVAALFITGTVGLLAAGAFRPRPPERTPPTSLLAEIRADGRVRIAIRPDQPQFTTGGQPATGFDADVAKELAKRLGVALELVIVDADTMLTRSEAGQWDVALPSVATWSIDGSRFLASDPYYSWPHFLVVSASSTATSASDVAQGPVCAVAGGAGDAWLRGSYGTSPGPAVTGSIVSARSDEECLSMVASGAARAVVTERLTSGDLQLLSGIRVIGGPAAEPRSAIVARPGGADRDSSDLLRAIDDALAQMHADGTLTRLSESRFGGVDLTTP